MKITQWQAQKLDLIITISMHSLNKHVHKLVIMKPRPSETASLTLMLGGN